MTAPDDLVELTRLRERVAALEAERGSEIGRITAAVGPLGQFGIEQRDRAERAEAERDAIRADAERLLLDAHATWHMCRLKDAERGLPAGTPCDDCIAMVRAAIDAARGEGMK